MFRIRLKELREKTGLSQYTFAEKFGVAQSTVGGWESGAREPNFDTTRKLADFFGVTIDYLLDGNESKDIEKKIPADDEVWEIREMLHKRPEMKVLFKLGTKATKEEVEQTIKIIKALNPDSEE